MNIEERLDALEKRNARVEMDKAWETSAARTAIIFMITYIVALIWLRTIGETGAYLKAVVPSLGWFLSTLTIPVAKKAWMKRTQKPL